MKKGLLIVAMMIGVTASAQDMNSKKGTPILPESGDWSIGIGANSSLNYFGNLLNGNTDNSPMSFDWTNGNDNVITGKMMKDANTAYRGQLRIGFGSTTTNEADPADGGLSSTKVSHMNINLAGGIQMYRGKGRLRGYYGGEVALGLGSGTDTTYSYKGTAADASVTKQDDGGTFSFGIRGFIGAEYFFAPKMSLSGEFGWGLGLSSKGEGKTVSVNTPDAKTGKTSSFGLDTDNAGAAINLNFYF